MTNEEKLLEINNYYHEELEKCLNIAYRLQEMELRYGIKLPPSIKKDIDEFEENFRFRYHDRD